MRDFRLVADRIENLSPGGMLAGPADPVLTGEPVIVSFRVPGFLDWIDTEAIVTRVVHGRRPGETRRSLGLAFSGLDAYSERLIQAFVQRLPPAPPDYRVMLRQGEQWRRRAAA